MATRYTRQYWYNGQIITEELLNHMEAGIALNDERIAALEMSPLTEEMIDDIFEEAMEYVDRA